MTVNSDSNTIIFVERQEKSHRTSEDRVPNIQSEPRLSAPLILHETSVTDLAGPGILPSTFLSATDIPQTTEQATIEAAKQIACAVCKMKDPTDCSVTFPAIGSAHALGLPETTDGFRLLDQRAYSVGNANGVELLTVFFIVHPDDEARVIPTIVTHSGTERLYGGRIRDQLRAWWRLQYNENLEELERRALESFTDKVARVVDTIRDFSERSLKLILPRLIISTISAAISIAVVQYILTERKEQQEHRRQRVAEVDKTLKVIASSGNPAVISSLTEEHIEDLFTAALNQNTPPEERKELVSHVIYLAYNDRTRGNKDELKAKVKPQRYRQVILEIAKNDGDPFIRDTAAQALGRLGYLVN